MHNQAVSLFLKLILVFLLLPLFVFYYLPLRHAVLLLIKLAHSVPLEIYLIHLTYVSSAAGHL